MGILIGNSQWEKDTALEIAKKLDCQTEQGVRLARSCRVIRQLRLALAATVENSKAWDKVKEVLKKADVDAITAKVRAKKAEEEKAP